MNESMGQIHGQISREQMHDMWLPYGERLTVSAEVSDDPTPRELVMMYQGADGFQKAKVVRAAVGDSEMPYDFNKAAFRFLLDGADDPTRQLLLESYGQQLEVVQGEIDDIRENGATYLKVFAKALGNIAAEGYITDDQADLMRSRLYDAEGGPLVQETPMTKVSLDRLYDSLTDGKMLPDSINYVTVMSLGIISHTLVMSSSKNYRSHTRSHELLHTVQGAEIHYGARSDGLDMPELNSVGLRWYDVNSADSIAKNKEADEGLIVILNEWMHNSTPELGPLLGYEDSLYYKWSKKIEFLHHNHPQLFRSMVNASLVDATLANPNAKVEALGEVHELGAAVLEEGGITKFMQTDGEFKDYHDNDKTPAAIASGD